MAGFPELRFNSPGQPLGGDTVARRESTPRLEKWDSQLWTWKSSSPLELSLIGPLNKAQNGGSLGLRTAGDPDGGEAQPDGRTAGEQHGPATARSEL